MAPLPFVLIVLLFYAVHVCAALAGLFILVHIDLATFSFDLIADTKKMAVCSLVAIAPTALLFYCFPVPHVLCSYVVLYFVAVKLTYLGITNAELIVIGITNLVAWVVLAVLLSKVLTAYLATGG
jgi:hypothetical protein